MRVVTLPSVPSSTAPESDTLSNSVSPCYKILAFRPDKARLSLLDADQVSTVLGCFSNLLADAPVLLLPFAFMGQPVYLKRSYPAPSLVCGDYFQTFTRVNPFVDVPSFWIEVHSKPFWLVEGSADDVLLSVAMQLADLLLKVTASVVTLRLAGLHLCLDVEADYAAIYGGMTCEELESSYVSRLIVAPAPGSEAYPSRVGCFPTSHYFGNSKNVRWNVYDKLAEMGARPKDYYAAVWDAAGHTPGASIVRVECQLGRQYFRSHAPEIVGDVSAVPADWLGSVVAVESWTGFLAAIWLDVSTRTRYTLDDDANRSRATTQPFWRTVQAVAFLVPSVGSIKRVMTSVMQSVTRDARAVGGYARSMAAKLRRADFLPMLEDVLDYVRSEVALSLAQAGTSWSSSVLERAQVRAIPYALADMDS